MRSGMKPETIPISKFKATCLSLLKKVKKQGEPIIVTLKGEPVAMVVPPPAAEKTSAWIGSLRSQGKIVGDIVEPVVEESKWDVLEQ
jgi:prevent-host-death family protein